MVTRRGNDLEQGWITPALIKRIGGGAAVDQVWSTSNPDFVAFTANTPGGVGRLDARVAFQNQISRLIGSISGRSVNWSFELRIPSISHKDGNTYFVPRAQGIALSHSDSASMEDYKYCVKEFLDTSTIHKILALIAYLTFLKKLDFFGIQFTDHKEDSIFLFVPMIDAHHIVITITDPGEDTKYPGITYQPGSITSETAELIKVCRSFFIDSLGKYSLTQKLFTLERYDAFRGDRGTITEEIQQLVPQIVEDLVIQQLISTGKLDFESVIDQLLAYCAQAQTNGSREKRVVNNLDRITISLREKL